MDETPYAFQHACRAAGVSPGNLNMRLERGLAAAFGPAASSVQRGVPRRFTAGEILTVATVEWLCRAREGLVPAGLAQACLPFWQEWFAKGVMPARYLVLHVRGAELEVFPVANGAELGSLCDAGLWLSAALVVPVRTIYADARVDLAETDLPLPELA